MTSVDGTTPEGGAAKSAAVAESLSTVGYAMFALLNTGPLETVPSMADFMERVREEEAAAQAYADANAAAVPEDEYDNFGVARSRALPVSASSAMDTGVPPVGGPSDSAPEGEEKREGYPQPKNPIGPTPEYTGNHTLKMLDEISFLDE